MKNKVVAMIIAASMVVGLGAGVGGACIYTNIKNAQTTEITATVENASPETVTSDSKEDKKADTVTAKPIQNTQKASDAKKAAEEKAAKEAAEKKAAEKKAAEKKAAEKKAAEKKAAEKKAAEQKTAEKKAAEKKAAEQKAAEKKAAEKKAAEKKAAEKKAAEEKAAKEAAQKKAAQEKAAKEAAQKKAAEEKAAKEAAEKKAAEEKAARERAEQIRIYQDTKTGMITSVDGNTISVRIEGGNATFDISNATVNGALMEGDNVTIIYDTDGTNISPLYVYDNTTDEERQANLDEWRGTGEQPAQETVEVQDEENIENDIEAAAEEQARIEEEMRQAEAERVAAEQAEAERIAAEQAEAERIAAEQAEAERAAAEEAERAAAEAAKAEETHSVSGTVTSVSDSSITISTDNGEKTLDASSVSTDGISEGSYVTVEYRNGSAVSIR